MTLLAILNRLYWPSVFFWGLGAVSSYALLIGLVTWSWANIGTAALAVSALYGALMLAIAFRGEPKV